MPLSPLQEAALISFIFNLGAGAFQASTLRQKLNRGEYVIAADELMRWVHAGGIRQRGLVRRRELERKLFLADIDLNQHGKNQPTRPSGAKYLLRQNPSADKNQISNAAIIAVLAIASVALPMAWAKASVKSSLKKLKARVT